MWCKGWLTRGFGTIEGKDNQESAYDQKAHVAPHHLLFGRLLQHCLGSLFQSGAAMALSFCRHALAKLSSDLCLSWHGDRAIRHPLSRSGARPRAGLVAGGGRSAWENFGADWPGLSHFERTMALVYNSVIDHQRS